jgi:drug/metabolite transporter (DMT)-like permease
MKKGYIYILLTALIFSTMEIASKMIAEQVDPYQLTFIRFFIGGIILLPFAIKELKNRDITLTKQDFLYFCIMGLLCVVISMSFFQLAVLYTKASTVAIVFSTNPIFTMPFAYFILKEKTNKKTILALIISLFGILFILNPFQLNLGKDFKGIIFAILAAVVFSLYSVLGKKRIEKFGGLTCNCFTFLVGVVMMFVFLLIFDKPIIAGINFSNICSVLYISIVVTGLGYLFYFLAMEETTATTASIAFFIKPALAPALSFLILGEKIPFNTLCGMVCIILGSYMAILSKKSSTTSSNV